jgi:ribosomal protein L37E
VVPQGPAQAEAATQGATATESEAEHVQGRSHRISWARLLKRAFDIDMQHCANCGAGELKIIAAILERPVIEKLLERMTGVGRLPACTNSGLPAPQVMKFGCQKAGTRHRLLTPHSRPPSGQVEVQLQTDCSRSGFAAQ